MNKRKILLSSLLYLVAASGLFTTASLCAQNRDTNQNDIQAGNSAPSVVKGKSDLSDTTVSYAPTGPMLEMSLEDMLLAAPMGMSKEERDFDFSHKAPSTIRSWSLTEFQSFVCNPVGKQAFLSQGQNWVCFRRMLRGQIRIGQDFISGKNITPPPPPKRIVLADGSQSVDPEFLSGDLAFSPQRLALTFESLKTCRQNISDLCKELEALKKIAAQKGKLKELEEQLSSFEWI